MVSGQFPRAKKTFILSAHEQDRFFVGDESPLKQRKSADDPSFAPAVLAAPSAGGGADARLYPRARRHVGQ